MVDKVEKINRLLAFSADRVNPTEKDKDVFIAGCKRLKSLLYGFDIIPGKGKINMSGYFIVIGCNDDFADVHIQFPNFLLKSVPI